MEAIIPVAALPKDASEVQYSDAVLRVYDTEKQGWRSFRLDSVLEYTPYAENFFQSQN